MNIGIIVESCSAVELATQQQSVEVLEVALGYARRGWRVLPCKPGRKEPLGHLVPHGLHDATTDEALIAGWWTEAPDANIGIATGSASGFFVVDIDVQHGGLDSWQQLIADVGLPDTIVVRTPSGGLHFYFEMPLDHTIRNSAGTFRPGIDVRGDGGYVIGPGSKTAAGCYTWDGSTDIAPAPQWLIKLITDSTEHTKSTEVHDHDTIPDGRRNNTLCRLAGALRRDGLSVNALEAALLVENRRRCRPPLPDRDVQAIARSVARYPSNSAAVLGDGVQAETKLQFATAADLARDVPADPCFIIRGYIAAGAITDLTGPAKTAGKTTFLAHAVRAVLDGRSFLGCSTMRTAAVWLTEERRPTFAEALRRSGLLGRADLHILHWHETVGTEWSSVARAAVARCLAVDARLLIVDTLPQFARLQGDAENNSGDALRAIEPLQRAAADGLAVVVVRHDRKGGGHVGESGRGSSAFTGAADIVVALRRPEGHARPTIRVLHALSRFGVTPESLVVELTEAGFVALGAESSVAILEAKRVLLDTLPSSGAAAMTLEEILAINRAVKRTALQKALDEDWVQRKGKGRKRDPYRYFRPVDDSAATQITDDGIKTALPSGPGPLDGQLVIGEQLP